MPKCSGTPMAELIPGTTCQGIPASGEPGLLLPPRPKTKLSPPFSRTTLLPSRAFRISSALMASWATLCRPLRFPTGSSSASGLASRRVSGATRHRRARSGPGTVPGVLPGSEGPVRSRSHQPHFSHCIFSAGHKVPPSGTGRAPAILFLSHRRARFPSTIAISSIRSPGRSRQWIPTGQEQSTFIAQNSCRSHRNRRQVSGSESCRRSRTSSRSWSGIPLHDALAAGRDHFLRRKGDHLEPAHVQFQPFNACHGQYDGIILSPFQLVEPVVTFPRISRNCRSGRCRLNSRIRRGLPVPTTFPSRSFLSRSSTRHPGDPPPGGYRRSPAWAS